MCIKFFEVKKPRKDVAVAPFPLPCALTAERDSSSELKYSRDAQHQERHSEGLWAFGRRKPTKISKILEVYI